MIGSVRRRRATERDAQPRAVIRESQLETLPEVVRQMLGSGWVEELTIDGTAPGRALEHLIQAGRDSGRRVRLTGAWSADPPPLQAGERWVPERVDHGHAWVLRLPQPSAWQVAMKRLIDVSVAAGLLLLLSPLLGALAIAVRLTSPGPAFYRWRVRGRYGCPFTGYKLRTMIQDADALKADLLEKNEMVGPVFKLTNDPRLTVIGRWLRRYSLDELPQLWNVLRGEMSLVGPRPPLLAEYQDYELWQMRKLSVTPGLTCLWQVNGRNAIRDFAQWARLDLLYIDHWSLLLDARILAQTPLAVLRGTGR